MALYYTIYDYNTIDLVWQVGDDHKKINDYGRNCKSIQADGDELELIRETFDNIPIHKDRPIQRWVGDMATFIAMNIQNR